MKKVIQSMSILLACGTLFLTSCNKEEKMEANPDHATQARTADDAADDGDYILKNDDFAAMYEEIRAENTEHFMVNANEAISITTEDGVILELPENSLMRMDGSMVEGEVVVSFNGLMDRGEMIIQDRGTNGVTPEGDVAPLKSGGEFFIEITQDEETLVLANPMGVKVPTAAPDPDMRMFVEADGTGDDLEWVIDEEREVEVLEREEGFFYGFEILPDLGDQWRGCNIDAFDIDWSCTMSDVSVEVPMGYDPTNTEVYIILCGTNQIANFDGWDAATNSFLEHRGLICEGTCVHFLLVTNVGGSMEYALHSSVSINPGSHVETFSAPFTAISASALAAVVNSLP